VNTPAYAAVNTPAYAAVNTPADPGVSTSAYAAVDTPADAGKCGKVGNLLFISEKEYVTIPIVFKKEGRIAMKHVKSLTTKNLQSTLKKGGCGECQTSCQSACKTSCTVGNQTCENK